MSTTFEVYHPESPGIRVFVRRNIFQQMMKLLSKSWMFANRSEKMLDISEVDVYVSLIPVDTKDDVHEDLDITNAVPDEKNPAYLLHASLPREQVVNTFGLLLAPMATSQLRILKQLCDNPSGPAFNSIRGVLIGLRLVNAINETTFLTIRYGMEIHFEPFCEALDNTLAKRTV